MFKKGNLVRLISDDGTKEVMSVQSDTVEASEYTYVFEGKDNTETMYKTNALELVKESQEELEKEKNSQPIEEQTVAIVSFEGAVKREVKAVREALKLCDNLSEFQLTITASGPINSGEVKVSYGLSKNTYGTAEVKGNNVKECLSEFLRRHGWDCINKPIAISYDGIPD